MPWDPAACLAAAASKMRRLAAWAFAAWLVSALAPAGAQGLESALSPGPLVQSHAKVDGDCSQCHVRFDRAAQDGRCIACHKDVGADLRAKTGFHGRQRPQPCRTCHTDHRGRDMKIAEFDRKAFDHRQTDYLLRGKHASVDCTACHPAARKYREAPQDCLACHRKDDKHKGSLGSQCGDCHTEASWKEARVDHDKTRFALTGKHAEARCDACHKTNVFNEAPRECIGCHRKDDKHKARYGEKCDSCHGTKNWTGITFRHDTDTRYPLRGKHRETRCDSCHTGVLYRDKLATDCLACHRKDDKHNGTLGTECGGCHTERNWREASGRFDHDKSRFKLRGGHAKVECKACHDTPRYRETPSDCVACHRKDDKHETTLGTDCAACHTDADWKASRFDHARTRFSLRDGHASPPLECKACHRDLRSFRPTATDCAACHRKDDKHERQLGERCESCHGTKNWRVPDYDHAKARFALEGSHVKVACKSCHATPRFRDAPRDCYGCHRKDDKHQLRFGEKCESCHGVQDWKRWDYDHAQRARYPLDAGHVKVPCEDCHHSPAPRGRPAAALDRSCIACHRHDDVHDGAFGPRCEQCHGATRWRHLTNRRLSGPAPATGGDDIARVLAMRQRRTPPS